MFIYKASNQFVHWHR